MFAEHIAGHGESDDALIKRLRAELETHFEVARRLRTLRDGYGEESVLRLLMIGQDEEEFHQVSLAMRQAGYDTPRVVEAALDRLEVEPDGECSDTIGRLLNEIKLTTAYAAEILVNLNRHPLGTVLEILVYLEEDITEEKRVRLLRTACNAYLDNQFVNPG